jgi:hypothetical protein
MNDKTPANINKRISNSSSTSAEGHSKEYPWIKCGQSLASRFRHHTIPKLKLLDTVWILTSDNKKFFIVCYTELGPQSDGILDELRLAEIGIQKETKVFIVPLSCALGIQKVVNKQKTLTGTESDVDEDEELESRNDESGSPTDASLPSHRNSSYRFVKSVRARLTVQKIIDSIRGQSTFTFDYVLFCVLASLISALGLLENSTV